MTTCKDMQWKQILLLSFYLILHLFVFISTSLRYDVDFNVGVANSRSTHSYCIQFSKSKIEDKRNLIFLVSLYVFVESHAFKCVLRGLSLNWRVLIWMNVSDWLNWLQWRHKKNVRLRGIEHDWIIADIGSDE